MRSDPLIRFEARAEQLEPRVLLAAFVVDSLADTSDGDFGSGQFTLREAIELANANAEADTITFAAGLSGKIEITGGALQITDELSVDGSAVPDLRIGRPVDTSGPLGSGTGLFDISNADESTFVVELSDLLLVDSYEAIDNSETLIIERLAIENNGQGIVNRSAGNLTIRLSTITGNGRASVNGAGVYNSGSASITDTSITDNLAYNAAGIYNAEGATMLLERSLVANNRAFNFATDRPGSVGSYGGGIANFGMLTVRNSTVSGNRVNNFAGLSTGSGIHNSGTLSVYNSTIAYNEGFGGIYHANGGLLLVSTIVSNNGYETTYRPPTNLDTVWNIVSTDGAIDTLSRNNLIGFGEVPSAFVNGVNGNLVGVNPALRPLAINGGPTRTHALVPGSPAIDAGANPLELETDQTGRERSVGARVDIGAFEADPDSGYTLLARSGSIVSSTADAANRHNVVSLTDLGTLVVFSEGWTAVDLHRLTGAPAAMGSAVIWTDPFSGLLNVSAVGENGEFLLFERNSQGGWVYFGADESAFGDLVNGGPAALLSQRITRVRAATVFVTREASNLDQHVILGFLVDTLENEVAKTELVYFIKTSRNELINDSQALLPAWSYTNLTTQFEDRGVTVPQFSGLIGYATPWNAWHFASVSNQGAVVSVWTAPSLSGQWRFSDLSAATTSDARLDPASELAVIQTSWRGINLTGTDADGNVFITWWVPSFGGVWAASDLTEIVGGPSLVASSLTGYGTSWNGMNYAGLDANGALYVYWWAPATNTWRADRLIDQVSNANTVPAVTGPLSSYASRGGTLNILGSAESGDVLRFSFRPGTPLWLAENLTDLAERQ